MFNYMTPLEGISVDPALTRWAGWLGGLQLTVPTCHPASNLARTVLQPEALGALGGGSNLHHLQAHSHLQVPTQTIDPQQLVALRDLQLEGGHVASGSGPSAPQADSVVAPL